MKEPVKPAPWGQETRQPGPRDERWRLSPGKLTAASSSRPQIEAGGRRHGEPELFLVSPKRLLVPIYLRLYFWKGAGKRLFLVRWWAVFCSELSFSPWETETRPSSLSATREGDAGGPGDGHGPRGEEDSSRSHTSCWQARERPRSPGSHTAALCTLSVATPTCLLWAWPEATVEDKQVDPKDSGRGRADGAGTLALSPGSEPGLVPHAP